MADLKPVMRAHGSHRLHDSLQVRNAVHLAVKQHDLLVAGRHGQRLHLRISPSPRAFLQRLVQRRAGAEELGGDVPPDRASRMEEEPRRKKCDEERRRGRRSGWRRGRGNGGGEHDPVASLGIALHVGREVDELRLCSGLLQLTL